MEVAVAFIKLNPIGGYRESEISSTKG